MARSKRTRKRKRRRTRATDTAASIYHSNIRRADESLAKSNITPRDDSWQDLVLEWFTASERDRDAMSQYIAAYEPQLGVDWARQMLRMEVFFQVEDYVQVVEHYNRALVRYPACPYLEMEVAGPMIRYGGDFWQARRLLGHAIEHLPSHAKPCYDMGFLHYLLGDFAGALDWYSRAIPLRTDDEKEMGARVLYNRAIVRYLLDGDRQAAIADLKQALGLYPAYEQGRKALRGFQRRSTKVSFVPW